MFKFKRPDSCYLALLPVLLKEGQRHDKPRCSHDIASAVSAGLFNMNFSNPETNCCFCQANLLAVRKGMFGL